MAISLPIDPILSEIAQTVKARKRLVLAAPPGAGKTSRVPLALAGLLDVEASTDGKILLLEPRRVAARLAAERLAATIGEKVGQTIGLSTRIDRRVSTQTRIEVITDGLFLRRLLSSPDLDGVGAVLFDEIHERRLNVDLGLALTCEIQDVFRDDLQFIAMSATLNTAQIADRLKAPIIETEGRQYPVETLYLGRNRDRIEDQMTKAILRATREQDGSILAFLPGAGEIRRTAERLEGQTDAEICPLYGALSPAQQDAAIRPAPDGHRKIVLATDIAESSLTIEGVSVVVDSGLSRVPDTARMDGSQSLITVRASRANVDQRQGRAGRLGPGACYRLWDEAETRGLEAAPTPEILNGDFSTARLVLGAWGERDAGRLTWLDTPPDGRMRAADALLTALGALDAEGGLTEKGQAMSALPLEPRLSALIVSAATDEEAALAARLAVLISEPGFAGGSTDLGERLQRFDRDTSRRGEALKRQAQRWGGGAKPKGDAANLLAAAWPDRIARRRAESQEQWLMASGRAVSVEPTDPLARSDWLVVADFIGGAKQARVTSALSISEKSVFAMRAPEQAETARFDPETNRFQARRVETVGAITLSETPLPKPSGAAARAAYLDCIAQQGFEPLGLQALVATYCARLQKMRDAGFEDWPECTVDSLKRSVHEWLGPYLGDGNTFQLPPNGKIADALLNQHDWTAQNTLNSEAPLTLDLPTGRRARVDWLDERAPLIEAKVQELYGQAEHPRLLGARVPVTLQFLSPGGKPVATTQDLPGFWQNGYLDMAKDMRGRYPKHDWPDDPAAAKSHAGVTKARLSRS